MKKFLALMLAMLMALSLVACGGGNNAADDNNANNGDDAAMTKLVLGTSADYAPFEFMYPDESGEMVYGGIDVSVAQYIADEMGVELQVENMGFDYLLTSLDKGDFDIVLAAMEATPDRLENADFSDPYYTDVPPAILVDGGVAKQYAEANPDLVIADASAELGEPAPYCVAVQKGDPKGLLPAINAAIAKMNEANMLETFIADADSLADVAVEVSAN